jgi:hypothetical protein
MRFSVGGTLAFRRSLEKKFFLSSSTIARRLEAWNFEVDDGMMAEEFGRMVKLRPPITKAQLDELRWLARGRQPCFGTHRTRVQNNLVLMGFARYIGVDGQPLDGVTGPTGIKYVTESCEITDDGLETVR